VNEQEVTEDIVRREHLSEVNAAAHWAYLIGVIAGAFILMVGLIAVLGGTGG
jgi:hypothetical protein